MVKLRCHAELDSASLMNEIPKPVRDDKCSGAGMTSPMQRCARNPAKPAETAITTQALWLRNKNKILSVNNLTVGNNFVSCFCN